MRETSWGRVKYRTTNWKSYNAALKARGELTSAVRSPTLGGVIGLGFVHRSHEEPGTKLAISAEPGKTSQATVVELPFT